VTEEIFGIYIRDQSVARVDDITYFSVVFQNEKVFGRAQDIHVGVEISIKFSVYYAV
jgi:hypothetical protein